MAHAGGRPLKFKSPKEMQVKIDDYFAVTPGSQWTITGLALALDTDRTTLINYENRDEFFDTIKKAKLMVENAYELSLRVKGGSGDIFALKNFGWSDRQEQEITVNNTQEILKAYGLGENYEGGNDRKDDEPLPDSSESKT